MADTRIIAVVNFKGGVGKSTSVINIGAALARAGRRVLLIDLDPQFNLSQSLGYLENDVTIYEALTEGEELPIQRVADNLSLVPSDIRLIQADIELVGEYKRETFLQRRLKPVSWKFDYILIDCPPSLGLLTQNAIEASTEIFTPISAEFLALKGYKILSEALERIDRQIDRVFITRYDSRKILNKNVVAVLQEELGPRLYRTIIRENVSLAEAPARGQDIFSYSPGSYGAEDYQSLAQEVLADEK